MLSLSDIQNAPTDLNQLTLWAQRNGHLPPPAPPPETPPLVPPATVTAQMSPVTPAQPKSDVAPMSSVTGTPDASHLGGMPESEIGGAATAVKPMTPPTVGTAAEDRQKLEDLQKKRAADTLASHDTFLGKLGHIAGRVGSIAGAAVAPGVTAMIPGSQLNLNLREAGLKGELEKRTAAEGVEKNREGEEELRKEQIKNVESEIAHRGEPKTPGEQTYNDLMKGGPDGGPQINPDTKQPYTHLEALEATEQAGQKQPVGGNAPVTPAGIEDYKTRLGTLGLQPNELAAYSNVPAGTTAAELEKRFTDAVGLKNKSQQERDFQLRNQEHLDDVAWRHQQSAEGMQEKREKAGEDLVIGYDKNNKAHLVSKADAQEEGLEHIQKAQPGDYDKAKTHHVVLNTLQTQLNSVVAASKALDQGIVQRGIIASALSHPTNGAIDELMRAAVMKGATEETKDYVTATLALREAGLALPKEITGGSRVTEVQASALWATQPGASSLNKKYALKQAKKFQQDIDRLRERAPEVRGQAIVDPDEEIKSKGTEKQHGAGGGGGATVKFGGQEYSIGADGTIDIPGKGKYKVTPGSKDLVKVK